MRFAEPCVNRQAQMLGNFVNIAFFFDELFDQRLIRTSDDRRLARIPGIAQGKQKIIFMAFQLERAFKEKKVMFAEAGVGTGKTLVYLLFALSYARYTGKPAVIACADETLIEQLVKKEGDIYCMPCDS